jgi:hypothetical protein
LGWACLKRKAVEGLNNQKGRGKKETIGPSGALCLQGELMGSPLYFFEHEIIPDNRYPIFNQSVTAVNNSTGASSVTNFYGADGRIYPLAFVFYAHYGFLKDSEVPVGRLHPYIGVGPGLTFSSLQIKGLGNSNAVNAALAVEGGIRYVLTASVTLDLALRYRYVQPDYSYTTPAGKVDVNFTAPSFTPLLRVAYHF